MISVPNRQAQKKVCSIHQPQTFPWLGYFHKIANSDIFVFLDNVQFKKNEWQNRNRILGSNGPQWITVPVIHNFGQTIKDVQINQKVRWQHKHLQAIKSNYGKAPYFDKYFPEIQDLYAQDWKNLSAFNIQTVLWGLEKLNIKTEIFTSSKQFNFYAEMTPDEKLVQICKAYNATTYLSGAGGHDYLNTSTFERNNIKVEFQKFSHPEYKQRQTPFVPFLSVLDLLFNEGDNASKILTGEL